MSESSFLRATRDSYDRTVAEYVEMVEGKLEALPLDRALLAAFAEMVRATGSRTVADIGCGPGLVTDLLRRLGLDAFGIDLSPGMIAYARRRFPDLRFEIGSMLDLDLPDASVAGVLAWYSVIHVPWPRRGEVFEQFHRVLTPGGRLLLAFQVGKEVRHRDEVFGRPVNLDWYRQDPQEVADLLRRSGFRLLSTTVQESDGTQPTAQGYLMAARD